MLSASCSFMLWLPVGRPWSFDSTLGKTNVKEYSLFTKIILDNAFGVR